MKYQLTKKAYDVAHKDKINDIYHPETEVETIWAETAKEAIYKYYLSDFLPDDYRMVDIRARRNKANDLYLFEGK